MKPKTCTSCNERLSLGSPNMLQLSRPPPQKNFRCLDHKSHKRCLPLGFYTANDPNQNRKGGLRKEVRKFKFKFEPSEKPGRASIHPSQKMGHHRCFSNSSGPVRVHSSKLFIRVGRKGKVPFFPLLACNERCILSKYNIIYTKAAESENTLNNFPPSCCACIGNQSLPKNALSPIFLRSTDVIHS